VELGKKKPGLTKVGKGRQQVTATVAKSPAQQQAEQDAFNQAVQQAAQQAQGGGGGGGDGGGDGDGGGGGDGGGYDQPMAPAGDTPWFDTDMPFSDAPDIDDSMMSGLPRAPARMAGIGAAPAAPGATPPAAGASGVQLLLYGAVIYFGWRWLKRGGR
jgi:hypothetical protein